MTSTVFALTGGIASGKTTVSAQFRRRALPVVDADELARRAVACGRPALRAIVESFGEQVLLPSGDLDRKKLGQIVFEDDQALSRLNSIVHPYVRELANTAFAVLGDRGEPLICYEIPLLFETHQQESYRPVVVVNSTAQQQLERLCQRSALSVRDAQARIDAQLPLAEKVKHADFVIENTGTKEACLRQADEVLARLVSDLGLATDHYLF